MMTLQTLVSILLLSAFALPLPAHAKGKAHAHGTVDVNLVTDAGSIKIQMTSPLDNLLGFERSPRTDAERQRVEAMATQLRAADKLFRLPPAAACQLNQVQLHAPVVGLKTPGAESEPSSTPQSGHSDLDALFEFTCAQAAQLSHLDIDLFKTFSGIQRINIQLVTPRGQTQQTLKRPAQRLKLE